MRERVELIQTTMGPGRVTVCGDGDSLLAIGHGAGGQSWSKDILASRDAALERGWVVALVDQPWRVAGRKVADRPPVLDDAWVPIVESLRTTNGARRLVVAGRSAGARVACRTSSRLGADAVLCLAFPLHLPGRPAASRIDELRLPIDAGLPVRVVQGERDPFSGPDEVRAGITDPSVVVAVPGTHSISATARVREVVSTWLASLPGE